MGIDPTPVKTKTLGVSPKLIAATIGFIVTYLLGQQVLDISEVAEVGLNISGIVVAAYLAPAGTVYDSEDFPTPTGDVRGDSSF
jgi:hypothetical protein